MVDFSSSSMHDDQSSGALSPNPQVDAPPAAATLPPQRPPAPSGPGPLARVIALVISVGLAWAIAVALSAWLLGLFLARG